MQSQVESVGTKQAGTTDKSQSTVITKTISEEHKSLFDFMKRQILAEGFTMVGKEEVTQVKSFWDFLTGEKFIYTATFEKSK